MSKIEFQELKEDEPFDPTTIHKNTPFTQASFYGDWQKVLGRTVRRFLVKDGGEVIAYFLLVKYPLLFGKNYLYAPYGPVAENLSRDLLINLKKELKNIAKTENAVFVRLDFTPVGSSKLLSKFFKKSPEYTYHSAYFQPRAEWFLRLGKSEEDLLKSMHKQTRYSIRLAERKEIEVKIITENFGEYFNDFYMLMEETAKRNGFSIHPKEYYKTIFDNLDKTNSYLAVASYGEQILAINLMVVYGGIATYVFGSSSNEERKRMPTYLAQWRAIQHAKKLGCDHYNFGGISIEGQVYKGWEGLTAFKKKFNGTEVIHSSFFDVVVNPVWYHLYNFRKFLKKFV